MTRFLLFCILLALAACAPASAGGTTVADSTTVAQTPTEVSVESQAAVSFGVLYPNSVLRQRIPANATYIPQTLVGAFRQSEDGWSMPIYRVEANSIPAQIPITNRFSGRLEHWEIPTYANPAPQADAHMGVWIPSLNIFYEFWDTHWNSARTAITAGGDVDYPASGDGISNPINQRTTAAGIALSNAMIMYEDFYVDGVYSTAIDAIHHAINVAVPSVACSDDIVFPAVGAETGCNNNSNGLPMGALLALPASLTDAQIDALDVHPFTRLLIRAARDYGIYVTDNNATPLYNGRSVATTRVESGLLRSLYGITNESAFMQRVQSETYAVVQQYGLFRVSWHDGTVLTPVTVTPATPTPVVSRTPTRTPTATRTATPVGTIFTATPTPAIVDCLLYWDRQLVCALP